MKLSSLLSSVLGGTGQLVNTASSLAILIGAIYLVDCRFSSKTPEARDSCYFTALPLMGVGGAAKGGFAVGYQTYNPNLRKPEDDTSPVRDIHGRFTRRDG